MKEPITNTGIESATDILRSKIQMIANIIVAYEKQLMQFDDVGIEICKLFDPEMTQLEVAKRLIKAVHTGNGTNSKEVEELVKEWNELEKKYQDVLNQLK